MSLLNGYRANQEPKKVNLTDTFFTDKGDMFCVIKESVSSLTGWRSFLCEDVLTGRRANFMQSDIVKLK